MNVNANAVPFVPGAASRQPTTQGGGAVPGPSGRSGVSATAAPFTPMFSSGGNQQQQQQQRDRASSDSLKLPDSLDDDLGALDLSGGGGEQQQQQMMLEQQQQQMMTYNDFYQQQQQQQQQQNRSFHARARETLHATEKHAKQVASRFVSETLRMEIR